MKLKLVYLVTIASMLIASNAMAKDLSQRIGAGFNSQIGLSQHLDAASVRYWINKNVGIQGDLAFMNFSPNNGASQTSFGIGGKFLYNFIEETNMNLYAGAGVYFFSQPPYNNTDSTEGGFSVSALSGIEFFLQGLPNLGFNLELDLGVRYLNGDGTAVGISADSINAGFHYYF